MKRYFFVNKTLAENFNFQYALLDNLKAGKHTIKVWIVDDPEVVIRKLVLSPESYKEETYLGPSQSAYVKYILLRIRKLKFEN